MTSQFTRSTPEDLTDILVIGRGPAGMTAALALSAQGKNVVIVGPPPSANDGRTTALMMPAISFLASLGIGLQDIEAAPLKTMRIIDATRRLLRAPTVTFHASEISEVAFGYNIANIQLNQVLHEALQRSKKIVCIDAKVDQWSYDQDRIAISTDDGQFLAARLAVAADGRFSCGRETARIAMRIRDLPQTALVTTFTHSLPHNDTSNEFHTENGPFTQVPLSEKNRSSLVWVCRPEEATRLCKLDRSEFAWAIEDQLQSVLGKITETGAIQSWPLKTGLPSSFAARRIALIGEAAHVFPPIGAQGLNLGLRDVMDLASCVKDAQDPGSDFVLSGYDAMRRPDVTARSGVVNAINGTLLSNLLPAQALRSSGLAILRNSPAFRNFFMREGMTPGGGFKQIARNFSRLREEISGKISSRDEKQQSRYRQDG